MIHGDGILVTITIGLVGAFVGGFAAKSVRLPPLVGYLLAGVVVGPFTPGFVANAEAAAELAEIGVVLLMFGVGIHFSLRDLFTVRAIAIPGALGQIAIATALGAALGLLWGWDLVSGVVLGLTIAVASTVVLIRALMERGALGSIHGRVAVGWLIVEDLFTVLVLVLLPVLAGSFAASAGSESSFTGVLTPLLALGVALAKIGILSALMLFVGVRVIPWLLVQVAHTGSKELFTLGVLALALGVALASAAVFSVSLALGAFLAGLVIGESDISHHAATDALPLRDAFAVLFFVSVGMLFDPLFLLKEPLKVLAILTAVIAGKGVVALVIVAALGYPLRTGLTVAAGLAQVGEFSFILAELAYGLRLLPDEGRNLVLAAAILSITLNPLLFRLIEPIEAWMRRRPWLSALLEGRAGALAWPSGSKADEGPRGHAVLCGYGNIGRLVASVLARRAFPFVVIDQDRRQVQELRRQGVAAVYGDAAVGVFLERAQVARARVLVVAIDDPPVTRHIVEQARLLNPRIAVVARTHSEHEWTYLRDHGVDDVVLGERELAAEMVRFTLYRFGVSSAELQAIVQRLRHRGAES